MKSFSSADPMLTNWAMLELQIDSASFQFFSSMKSLYHDLLKVDHDCGHWKTTTKKAGLNE